MTTCEECGAAVADVEKHELWHGKVDDIAATADDASDKADHVSNVLYQRGID